jgi:hypothetical protein
MLEVDIDASDWTNGTHFYDALLLAPGAPDWHGRNPNAILDSMIWNRVNAVQAPYRVRIRGTAQLPLQLRDHIKSVSKAIGKARAEYKEPHGGDVDVQLDILP